MLLACHCTCRAIIFGFHSPSSAAIVSNPLQSWRSPTLLSAVMATLLLPLLSSPPTPSNRFIVVFYIAWYFWSCQSQSLFIVFPLFKCLLFIHCLFIIWLVIYHLFIDCCLFIVRHACVVALPCVDCCVGKKNLRLQQDVARLIALVTTMLQGLKV